MWQIYEFAEYTDPDYLLTKTNIHIHPQVFLEYQDLVDELSEICNRHQHYLDIHYSKTINNFRIGIPTITELNSIPTGTDYQTYSISIDMGQHKLYGFIKKITK